MQIHTEILPVGDVIITRKNNFMVKYGISDKLLIVKYM